MTGRSIATMFSGGGLVEAGAVLAGYMPAWGIEIDPAAALAYSANFGPHIIVKSVLDVDPRSLEPVDVLWVSPPCPSFSQARDVSLPSRGDEELTLAVIPFLEVLKPRAFFLENVPPFLTKGWHVLKPVIDALYRLGYTVDWSCINAADFGVPQTRNRFILRAVRGGLLRPLPAPVPWVGWYEAIEDLIPTLPDSQFAKWQLERLKDHPVYGDFLLMTGNTQIANPTGTGIKGAKEPANTVNATQSQYARAFLVDGVSMRVMPIRDGAAPALTVTTTHGIPRAFICSDKHVDPRSEEEPMNTVTASQRALPRAFLVESKNMNKWGDLTRDAHEPARTVMSDDRPSHAPKAVLLVAGQDACRGISVRHADDPAFTITGGGVKAPVRADMQGRVVSMTPRALARFQSVPDSYVLPSKRSVACRVIGNGVPSLLVKRLLEEIA